MLFRYLPKPVRHNEDLRAYTEVMRSVAAAMNLPFIDLFNPVKPFQDDKSGSPLTFSQPVGGAAAKYFRVEAK